MSEKNKKAVIVLISIISLIVMITGYFIFEIYQMQNNKSDNSQMNRDSIAKILKEVKKQERKQKVQKTTNNNFNRSISSNRTPSSINDSKNNVINHVVMSEKKFKRFPPYNRPLKDKTMDPIVRTHSIDYRVMRGQHKDSLSLSVWSEKPYYSLNEDIVIRAKLTGKSIIQNAKLTARLEDPDRKISYKFPLRYFKGSYNHIIPISKVTKPGLYKVFIDYYDPKKVKEKNIHASVVFMISNPEAKFTGKYLEKLIKGNLIFTAQIDVSMNYAKHESYYVQATLYDKDDNPIAVTQSQQYLTKGKHWVNLIFYGSLIFDHKKNGPYYIKNIQLAKAVMPLQFAPPKKLSFKTKKYAFNDFTSEDFIKD